MKLSKFLFIVFTFLVTAGALFLSGCVPAHAQSVDQKSGTPKYVKTTEDTVTARTGNSSQRRQVMITAETVSGTANKDLITYLSNDAGTKDVNTYFKVQNGKVYIAEFTGNKVYRKASADSVFSQVIFGKVSLMGNILDNPDIKYTTVLKTKNVLVVSVDLDKIAPMLASRFYKSKLYPNKAKIIRS